MQNVSRDTRGVHNDDKKSGRSTNGIEHSGATNVQLDLARSTWNLSVELNRVLERSLATSYAAVVSTKPHSAAPHCRAVAGTCAERFRTFPLPTLEVKRPLDYLRT